MNASNIVETILEAERAMPLQTSVIKTANGRTRAHFRPSSKKTSDKPAPAPAPVVTASPSETPTANKRPPFTRERAITLLLKAGKSNLKMGMTRAEALEKAYQWVDGLAKASTDLTEEERSACREKLNDFASRMVATFKKEDAAPTPPVEQKTGRPIPPMPKPTITAEAAVDRLFKGLGLNTEVFVTEADIDDAVKASRRPLETIAQIVIHVLKVEDLGWKSRLLTCCEKQVAKHYAANPVKGETAEQSAEKWMKDWLEKLIPSSRVRRTVRVEVTHRLNLRPDTKPVAPLPVPPKAATPKEKLPDLLTGLLQAAKPSAPPAATQEEPMAEPQPKAPITVQTVAEEPTPEEPKAAKPTGPTNAEARRALNKAEHLRRQALQAAKRADPNYGACKLTPAKGEGERGKRPSKKDLRKQAQAGHPCVR